MVTNSVVRIEAELLKKIEALRKNNKKMRRKYDNCKQFVNMAVDKLLDEEGG